MSLSNCTIHVVGAGLAGSECAYQLAQRGFKVKLFEMRGIKSTPAHKTEKFAELVCSNSLGSTTDYSAPGQLKWEAKKLNSLILDSAEFAAVPAGMALGVDREKFAERITICIRNHPNIECINKIVTNLDELPRPTVIATGPLTDNDLAQSMRNHFDNEFLYFFDAIAPIIDADSINTELVWRADRWDKGSGDYLNCPLDKEQYFNLIKEIQNARTIEPKEFEKDTPYFEACMPIEEIVRRGENSLRFGPLSPKGLRNPRTEKNEYAIVQLRQENREATAYNMVGFQTKMAYPEQKRIFQMIPGLEEAEFLKLGSMHRNLYIESPKKLNGDLSSKKDPNLYFAGQITGVEGYFESACMGLLVARFLGDKLEDKTFKPPPPESAFGALLKNLTEDKEHFQPTNINFGLLPAYTSSDGKKIPKREKRELMLTRAQQHFSTWISNC